MSLIVLGDVPTKAVRCSRCARVRTGGTGADWFDHPATLPREMPGTCATCAELLRRLAAQRRVREGRRLLRQRAKGYGPAQAGENPFNGFEGE